jgi:hypothetical protein
MWRTEEQALIRCIALKIRIKVGVECNTKYTLDQSLSLGAVRENHLWLATNGAHPLIL